MASEAAKRVGTQIRRARVEKGWTQKQLGNALPGFSGGDQVSKWERGEHRPHDDTLAHIARALDKDLAFFLAPEEAPETPDVMAAIGGAPEASPLDRISAQLEAVLAELQQLRGVADATQVQIQVVAAAVEAQAALASAGSGTRSGQARRSG
jgi:transcriptional regulator with XRE-family HTH domain